MINGPTTRPQKEASAQLGGTQDGLLVIQADHTINRLRNGLRDNEAPQNMCINRADAVTIDAF